MELKLSISVSATGHKLPEGVSITLTPSLGPVLFEVDQFATIFISHSAEQTHGRRQ